MAKNNVMQYLFFLFLFVNIGDLITSYFILVAESNPIFLLFGNPWILYILKIALSIGVGLIVFKNKYPSHFTYFTFVVIMVYGTLAFGFGVYNNMQAILNPQILVDAAQVPQNIKTQAYINFVSIIYYLPVTLTLISFKLYELSISNVNINKK